MPRAKAENAAAETEAKVEAKTEAKTETKAAAKKEKEPVMYVGPTVAGFGIQNQVLSDIPESIKGTLEKEPELKNLFIPIIEYPEACRMLREKRGYIYSAYKKALTLKNGGK